MCVCVCVYLVHDGSAELVEVVHGRQDRGGLLRVAPNHALPAGGERV